MSHQLMRLGGIVALLILAGCSGGGGGGPSELQAPLASITFPPLSFEFDGDLITVRGTASDASGVAGVRVNGVPAISADGFATWEASIPLSPNANTLTVETEDVFGNIDVAAATADGFRQGGFSIATFQSSSQPVRLVFDPVNRRLLGISSNPLGSQEIVAVDADTGFRQALVQLPEGADPSVAGTNIFDSAFDPVRGTIIAVGTTATSQRPLVAFGPDTGSVTTLIAPPVDPRALAYDPIRARILVFDVFAGAIVAVDPQTLQVTEVSGPSVGSGPLVYQNGLVGHPRLVVDETNNRILLLNLSPGFDRAIWDIDPVSGDRTFTTPAVLDAAFLGAAWDTATQRLLLLRGLGNATSSDLVAVDTVTGNVETLATELFETGWPSRSLPFDGQTGTVFVRDDGGIEAFDASTGDPSMISSWAEVGSLQSGSLSVDTEDGVIYVTAPSKTIGAARIEGRDIRTAELVFTWENDFPTSPLPSPQRVVWDPVGQRLIYRSLGTVAAVDPTTGTGQVISGAAAGFGTGIPFSNVSPPPAFTISDDGMKLYCADFGAGPSRIVEVDLVSGDRTLFHESGTPGEPTSYVLLHTVILDGANQRLLLGDFNAVLALDLATGATTLVSGRGVGTGPEMQSLSGLGYDATSGRLVVSDLFSNSLLAVDPVTGDRTSLLQSAGAARLAASPNPGILVAAGLFGGLAPYESAIGLIDLDTGHLPMLRPRTTR